MFALGLTCAALGAMLLGAYVLLEVADVDTLADLGD